jgi:hypothetical protein
MCVNCGCSGCMMCGQVVADGKCTGCGLPPEECNCEVEES